MFTLPNHPQAPSLLPNPEAVTPEVVKESGDGNRANETLLKTKMFVYNLLDVIPTEFKRMCTNSIGLLYIDVYAHHTTKHSHLPTTSIAMMFAP